MSNTRQAKPKPLRSLAAAASDDGPVQVVQAQAEGASTAETVEFCGATFRVAPKVGLMPLLKFAHSASKGISDEDMDGMAAMYAMIRDCIHQGELPCGECEACTSPPQRCPLGGRCGYCDADPPLYHRCPGFLPGGCQYFDAGDWERFERVAIDEHAGGEELFTVVNEVMEIVTARPTRPPGNSSRTARRTSAKSRALSSRREHADMVPVGEFLRSTS